MTNNMIVLFKALTLTAIIITLTIGVGCNNVHKNNKCDDYRFKSKKSLRFDVYQNPDIIDTPPEKYEKIIELFKKKINQIKTIKITNESKENEEGIRIRVGEIGDKCMPQIVQYKTAVIKTKQDIYELTIRITWDSEGGNSEIKQLKNNIYNTVLPYSVYHVDSLKKSSLISDCSSCYESTIPGYSKDEANLPLIKIYDENIRVVIYYNSGILKKDYNQNIAMVNQIYICLKNAIDTYFISNN